MTSQTPYSLTVNKNRRDEEVEALNPMTEEMFYVKKVAAPVKVMLKSEKKWVILEAVENRMLGDLV